MYSFSTEYYDLPEVAPYSAINLSLVYFVPASVHLEEEGGRSRAVEELAHNYLHPVTIMMSKVKLGVFGAIEREMAPRDQFDRGVS